MTSLRDNRQQLIFGLIAGVVAFGVGYIDRLSTAGLLWGLLAANLYATAYRRRPA